MTDLGESTEVTIDGVKFTLRDFDVKTATRLSSKLFPLVGEALKGMAKEFKDGVKPDPNNQGAWLELVGTLLPKATPELVEELRSTCARFSSYDNGHDDQGRHMQPELEHEANFNRCFKRKIGLMYKWIGESLKYNYADFLAGLVAAQARAAKSPEKAPSPPPA